MEFVYNDGGRKDAGYKGVANDCVCRAIATATEKPYKEIYKLINDFGKREKITKRKPDRSSARTGVYPETIKAVMEFLGWTWVPTMKIGSGCKVHLTETELPSGRLVVNLSKHTTCVIDGVLYDTYDCTRDGSRCVYGYFYKK